jgi:hypothetical protein
MNTTATLDAVTIYLDAAVCVRRALLEPGNGKVSAQVRVVGLPLAITAGSVRARVLKGPAGLRVLDVRPAFDVEFADELDVPTEAKALEKAQDDKARFEVLAKQLTTEIAELQALRPRFLEQERADKPREAHVSSMLALADFVSAELDEKLARQRALHKELDDAEEEVRLRRCRLKEASTAKRTERARVSRAVVVMLSDPSTEPVELAVEYQVSGARWVPSYELRLERGFTSGTLMMRASVAQDTGEDWSGVTLALSTASLHRCTDVPELRALKIGRRQPEPPRSGWREPPPGLDELFEEYDAALAALPHDTATAANHTRRGEQSTGERPEVLSELIEEGSPPSHTRTLGAGESPLSAPAPPSADKDVLTSCLDVQLDALESEESMTLLPPTSRPRMSAWKMQHLAARGKAVPRGVKEMEGLALRIPESQVVSAEAMPLEDSGSRPIASAHKVPAFVPDDSFMDYDRLVMPGQAGPERRGCLTTASEWQYAFVTGVSVQVDVFLAMVARASQRANLVTSLALPANCTPPHSIDSFDYRFDYARRVDVPSTGKWTVVPVMTCDVKLTPGFVCVPSLEQKVYRTLEIDNSSQHALLPGPVNVSVGDEFLLTAQLPAIPPGADARRLGLGVEEAIKVARKTQFKETTGGFFGGSSLLAHEIEIELNNRLDSPAKIEVRERIPYAPPSERDLEVEDSAVTPSWEKIETVDGEPIRGARCWKVTVPPGQTLVLKAEYTIRMPAGKMLVGGNRRI